MYPIRSARLPRTIRHSDHARLDPHGCFEIWLKMTRRSMMRNNVRRQIQNIKFKCKYKYKHCQRHNGPEGWVLLTKVTPLGHITSSYANLDQTSSESRPSTNFKTSTKHQHELIQTWNLRTCEDSPGCFIQSWIWVILRCWGNSSMVCQQNSDAL